MTPSIEAVKALDGKILAMLNSDEQATLDFYRAKGRKHGVSIQIESKADPIALASAKSEDEADAILKSANSIVRVNALGDGESVEEWQAAMDRERP